MSERGDREDELPPGPSAIALPLNYHEDDSAHSIVDLPGGWRFESQRWLATLNPGRTQREYQKAISYFFATPGVPLEIAALTFDLLLAYRGALAMRATAHAETQPRRAPRSGPRRSLDGSAPAQLENPGGEARESVNSATMSASDGGKDPGPLAPATVNIRLTALRQFLVYCSLYGSAITALTPDQIRGALRRLSIERRRPYQTLAEPEWAQFLAAARLPGTFHPAPTSEAVITSAKPAQAKGPWGTPRAVREEERTVRQQVEESEREGDDETDAAEEARKGERGLLRSKAGLTGERTAPRDHALLALALATGLRAIELASLDVGDLSREWRAGQEEWWLVLPDSKTKGQGGGRTLPLAPELVQVLRDYLELTGRYWERPEDRETPLFLSGAVRNMRAEPGRAARRGTESRVMRRLSPGQIRLIVDRVETQWQALYAGVDGQRGRRAGAARRISPHALRHSTAIALLEGNTASGRPPASVEHVRGWLGHLDIRTTQGYLAHIDARRHRRPFTLALGEGRDAPGGQDSNE